MADPTGVRLGTDGWLSTRLDGGIQIHARVRSDSEQNLRVTGVLIEGDDITSDTFRAVQLSRIIAAARFTGGLDLTKLVTAYSKVDDSQTTLGDLRARATKTLRVPKRRKLQRPDGSNPDAFYREVGDAYRSAATESTRPAVTLAEENDVPVGTVRRWIAEARRRGHIAPAAKGRAGR